MSIEHDELQSQRIIATVWRNAACVVCTLLLFALRFMVPVWLAPPIGVAFVLSATVCMLCSGAVLWCRYRLWRIG